MCGSSRVITLGVDEVGIGVREEVGDTESGIESGLFWGRMSKMSGPPIVIESIGGRVKN